MANIKFEEASHRYIDQSGKDLISVSKFTEKFKEKVNWDEIARKSAIKATKETGLKITKDDILAKWARKRDISASIGTLLHSIREKELIDADSPEFYNVKCAKKECTFLDGDKYSIPINQLENGVVYPELMIYDLDHMICGQSDKVIVTNNTIHIWDYKTDAEITFKGFSNQWTKVRKLLPPLDKLDDCNGNLYSIKMSLYMYMLWKANSGRFKPGELVIEHEILERDPANDNIAILDASGNPVVLDRKQIRLPYRKKEVEAMLKTIK